jgi:hypothetical protein
LWAASSLSRFGLLAAITVTVMDSTTTATASTMMTFMRAMLTTTTTTLRRPTDCQAYENKFHLAKQHKLISFKKRKMGLSYLHKKKWHPSNMDNVR